MQLFGKLFVDLHIQKEMEIYTSYFARQGKLREAGIVPIGIALWPPKFFQGLHLQYLAPKRYMMKDEVTREQYIQMYYRDVVGHLNPAQVIADIERMSQGKDAALLCYEKPGDFCHRRLFADWMLRETGLEIKEWEPSQKQIEEQVAKQMQTPVLEEPSLFDGLF